MISPATASHPDLPPLRPLSAAEIAERKGGEEPGRRRTATAASGAGLSAEQKREVEALERADAEIRRHEAAHKSAGGRYAGAASFEYQVGPDGKRYAVAGEVPIDVSPVPGDPQATIAKMQVVKRAAGAPARPSGQDRAVAAAAAKLEAEARAELGAQRAEAAGEEGGAATSASQLAALVAARYAETAEVGGAPDGSVGAVSAPRIERFA